MVVCSAAYKTVLSRQKGSQLVAPTTDTRLNRSDPAEFVLLLHEMFDGWSYSGPRTVTEQDTSDVLENVLTPQEHLLQAQDGQGQSTMKLMTV